MKAEDTVEEVEEAEDMEVNIVIYYLESFLYLKIEYEDYTWVYGQNPLDYPLL